MLSADHKKVTLSILGRADRIHKDYKNAKQREIEFLVAQLDNNASLVFIDCNDNATFLGGELIKQALESRKSNTPPWPNPRVRYTDSGHISAVIHDADTKNIIERLQSISGPMTSAHVEVCSALIERRIDSLCQPSALTAGAAKVSQFVSSTFDRARNQKVREDVDPVNTKKLALLRGLISLADLFIANGFDLTDWSGRMMARLIKKTDKLESIAINTVMELSSYSQYFPVLDCLFEELKPKHINVQIENAQDFMVSLKRLQGSSELLKNISQVFLFQSLPELTGDNLQIVKLWVCLSIRGHGSNPGELLAIVNDFIQKICASKNLDISDKLIQLLSLPSSYNTSDSQEINLEILHKNIHALWGKFIEQKKYRKREVQCLKAIFRSPSSCPETLAIFLESIKKEGSIPEHYVFHGEDNLLAEIFDLKNKSIELFKSAVPFLESVGGGRSDILTQFLYAQGKSILMLAAQSNNSAVIGSALSLFSSKHSLYVGNSKAQFSEFATWLAGIVTNVDYALELRKQLLNTALNIPDKSTVQQILLAPLVGEIDEAGSVNNIPLLDHVLHQDDPDFMLITAVRTLCLVDSKSGLNSKSDEASFLKKSGLIMSDGENLLNSYRQYCKNIFVSNFELSHCKSAGEKVDQSKVMGRIIALLPYDEWRTLLFVQRRNTIHSSFGFLTKSSGAGDLIDALEKYNSEVIALIQPVLLLEIMHYFLEKVRGDCPAVEFAAKVDCFIGYVSFRLGDKQFVEAPRLDYQAKYSVNSAFNNLFAQLPKEGCMPIVERAVVFSSAVRFCQEQKDLLTERKANGVGFGDNQAQFLKLLSFLIDKFPGVSQVDSLCMKEPSCPPGPLSSRKNHVQEDAHDGVSSVVAMHIDAPKEDGVPGVDALKEDAVPVVAVPIDGQEDGAPFASAFWAPQVTVVPSAPPASSCGAKYGA